jgi:hypothetical protein
MKCVICDLEIEDRYGFSAAPFREGKCCEECQRVVVFPLRVLLVKQQIKKSDE